MPTKVRVSKPQHAALLAKVGTNGIIAGSAVVKIIEDNLNDTEKMKAELKDFIGQLNAAVS